MRYALRMPFTVRAAGCLAASAALVLLLHAPAATQTASQITPQTFRPDLPRLEGAVVFSGEPGLEPPPGAERLSVTLSGVTVEGGFPDMEPAERVLERRLTEGPIPVAAIFVAAQDLEAAYARAGYVLARVAVPAQSLRDGDSLRLVVVDGFVEDVRLEEVPPRARERTRAVTAPLVGQRGLTLGEIERRLLIAGDTPGVALNSALTAGETPGGTLLVLEGEHRPVTGFVGFDNTLSEELGRWVVSSGLELNSVAGRGEAIYFRASGHPSGDDADGLGGLFTDRPTVRVLAAGAVAPIGVNGLTVNLEGTASRETPEAAGDIRTASEFTRASLRLRQPFVRTRALTVNGEAIFDLISEDVVQIVPDLGEFGLSRDRTRVLRAAADAAWTLEDGSAASLRAIASLGIDAFGARSGTPDLPLSRAGADPSFQKLEVSGSYRRPLGERLTGVFYARGQTSFGQTMASSERFGIASLGELSTFDAGSIGGDSGWVARAELQAPLTAPVGGRVVQVTPYGFAGTGALYLENPQDDEPSTLQVSSVGVGVTLARPLDRFFAGPSLVAEFGRSFRNDGGGDENRFTVVGSFRF
jgi:hemolysin activation/secretion protein